MSQSYGTIAGYSVLGLAMGAAGGLGMYYGTRGITKTLQEIQDDQPWLLPLIGTLAGFGAAAVIGIKITSRSPVKEVLQAAT